MLPLRVSAISYVNTAPLMRDFRQGHPGFEISYTVPSKCAAELAVGSADIGIIPTAAYINIPDLAIIPGVSIASKSAVRSILLVSKVPLENIRSVALDNSSLTSVALIQLLFAKWWNAAPNFVSAVPDLPTMLQRCDAALVIGDTALQVDRAQYLTYDLAEEWVRFTSKPFVFAFWAVRRAALAGWSSHLALPGIFQRSRDNGLKRESLNDIAREWACRLALSEGSIITYLTQNIFYGLDVECLEGLKLFYEYAGDLGLLPPPHGLHFLEAENLATI